MGHIRWISTFDLLSIPEAKEIVVNNDYFEFYKLLNTIGFDVNKEIEWQEVYSRSLIDHRIICLGRYVGFERLDDEWVNSEYCTFENRLIAAGKRDTGLMLEMSAMSRTSNFTGMLVEHIERELGKGIPLEIADEDDAIFDMVKESNKYRNKQE